MKLIYIDTETGGIDYPESALIQLAGIIEIDGEEKDSFNYNIKPFPGDKVEDGALAVNNVSREDLSGYEDPKSTYRTFIQLLGKYVNKYDKTDKLHFVAYGAGFDAGHVRAWFEKCGDKYYGSWFWWPPIDVMGIAAYAMMKQRHEMPNFKLMTAARAAGIEIDDSKLHDAMYDIEITRELWRAL